MLEVTGLSTGYGAGDVIHDMNLRVGAGEIRLDGEPIQRLTSAERVRKGDSRGCGAGPQAHVGREV